MVSVYVAERMLLLVFDNLFKGADTLCRGNLDLEDMAGIIT